MERYDDLRFYTVAALNKVYSFLKTGSSIWGSGKILINVSVPNLMAPSGLLPSSGFSLSLSLSHLCPYKISVLSGLAWYVIYCDQPLSYSIVNIF